MRLRTLRSTLALLTISTMAWRGAAELMFLKHWTTMPGPKWGLRAIHLSVCRAGLWTFTTSDLLTVSCTNSGVMLSHGNEGLSMISLNRPNNRLTIDATLDLWYSFNRISTAPCLINSSPSSASPSAFCPISSSSSGSKQSAKSKEQREDCWGEKKKKREGDERGWHGVGRGSF